MNTGGNRVGWNSIKGVKKNYTRLINRNVIGSSVHAGWELDFCPTNMGQTDRGPIVPDN